jgi:hypothetical protein
MNGDRRKAAEITPVRVLQTVRLAQGRIATILYELDQFLDPSAPGSRMLTCTRLRARTPLEQEETPRLALMYFNLERPIPSAFISQK